ncbi:hypothetical protein SLE2022_104430 [Rubroshorea leprosula]
MERRKEVGSSSSSLASELFGSKDSPSSSTGIFASIFAPRDSKVLGRESLRPPDSMANKQYRPNEVWNTKPGVYGHTSKGRESEGQNAQRVEPYGPCHLSSSIYYGGPDVVSEPQSAQASGVNSVYMEGGEDDSQSASRGNWWQGSLYY